MFKVQTFSLLKLLCNALLLCKQKSVLLNLLLKIFSKNVLHLHLYNIKKTYYLHILFDFVNVKNKSHKKTFL